MQPITNPPVPYVGSIQGGFSPGSMVRIQGQVPPNAERFNINLHCGQPPSDIALHVSVRLLQNYIARNSLDDGAWGGEEGDGNLPIAPGQRFEILILSDPGSYKIAINGNHFCEFRHRMPVQKVNYIAIDGEVTLGLISFESGASAPSQSGPPFAGGPDYLYGPPSGYGAPSQQGYGGPPQEGYGPPRPAHMSTPATSAPLLNRLNPVGMPMPTSVPIPPPSQLQYHNYPHPPGPPVPMPQSTPYTPQMPPYGSIPTHGHLPPAGPGAYPTQMPMMNLPNYGPQPVYPHKKMKKSKLKKAMKYGLPLAGAGLGAYAVSQAIGHHHHHRRRSSSSSSSSSSD